MHSRRPKSDFWNLFMDWSLVLTLSADSWGKQLTVDFFPENRWSHVGCMCIAHMLSMMLVAMISLELLLCIYYTMHILCTWCACILLFFHDSLDSLVLLRYRGQGKQRGVVRSFDFEAARFERAQARHRTSASHANRTTTARIKHLITEISKQHPNDMKFTTIIGVAATLLGVAFTSSAEAEKIGAEIAALRGKVSGKMVSVSFVPDLFLDILTPVCFQS